MTERLSQEEIDQLLYAINGEDIDSITSPKPPRIKIYDFMRPDKFSFDQIRTLSLLHEKLIPFWKKTFSYCKINTLYVASVDQMTYEEFYRSLPSPTSIFITQGIFNSSLLPAPVIIEIGPNITVPLITGLFCRTKPESESDYLHTHDLTSIDKSALRYIGKKIIDTYSQLWNNYCGLTLDSKNLVLETDPQSICGTVPSSEMNIAITMEISIDDVEDMINIFLPLSFLEPLMPFLTPEYFLSGPLKKTTPKGLANNFSVVLRVEYFREVINFKEIKNIHPGSIIHPFCPCQKEFFNVLVDDFVLFRGEIIDDKNNCEIHRSIKIETINPHKEHDFMTNRDSMKIEKTLDNMKVVLAVEIGRTVTTLKDIFVLQEGSIVNLDSLAGEPVSVFANNTLIAKGEIVVINQNFGVRICELAGDLEQEEEHAV
jgi:flagellar motor switch protein FliM